MVCSEKTVQESLLGLYSRMKEGADLLLLQSFLWNLEYEDDGRKNKLFVICCATESTALQVRVSEAQRPIHCDSTLTAKGNKSQEEVAKVA